MQLSIRLISLLLFMHVSTLLHAEDNPNVEAWVRQTLLTTLSVNYMQNNADFAAVKADYTFNAWNALTGFLGEYLLVIREKQLTLHPQFIDEPQVVDSGVVSGIHFWRVNQILAIPELQLDIAFSLVILLRNTPGRAPYIIQSMDIIKQELPNHP